MTRKIIGIGGAILDQLLPVSEAYLATIPGEKGGMEPIDFASLQSIIEASGSKPISVLGGSSRNVLAGLARLGNCCALLGMVGSDKRGERYRKLLEKQGIESLLLEGDLPTGIVLSMVTPDGERTMRTFQGATTQLGGHDLNVDMFCGAQLVHVEGYALFNDELAEKAMYYAKKVGARISFDMASFEIVRANKEHINHLIDSYVDIVFANEDESRAFCQQEPIEAAKLLANRCETAVILMGEQGSIIGQGDKLIEAAAYRVDPVDTTGAGDLYTSGFVHGYLSGQSLESCAHFGAVLGRAVVQVMGPAIPEEFWGSLNAPLRREVSTVDA